MIILSDTLFSSAHEIVTWVDKLATPILILTTIMVGALMAVSNYQKKAHGEKRGSQDKKSPSTP